MEEFDEAVVRSGDISQGSWEVSNNVAQNNVQNNYYIDERELHLRVQNTVNKYSEHIQSYNISTGVTNEQVISLMRAVLTSKNIDENTKNAIRNKFDMVEKGLGDCSQNVTNLLEGLYAVNASNEQIRQQQNIFEMNVAQYVTATVGQGQDRINNLENKLSDAINKIDNENVKNGLEEIMKRVGKLEISNLGFGADDKNKKKIVCIIKIYA
jgi:hypothetical protein